MICLLLSSLSAFTLPALPTAAALGFYVSYFHAGNPSIVGHFVISHFHSSQQVCAAWAQTNKLALDTIPTEPIVAVNIAAVVPFG